MASRDQTGRSLSSCQTFRPTRKMTERPHCDHRREYALIVRTARRTTAWWFVRNRRLLIFMRQGEGHGRLVPVPIDHAGDLLALRIHEGRADRAGWGLVVVELGQGRAREDGRREEVEVAIEGFGRGLEAEGEHLIDLRGQSDLHL
jgi:hypothetical protein